MQTTATAAMTAGLARFGQAKPELTPMHTHDFTSRYMIWTGLHDESLFKLRSRYRSLKQRGLTGIFLSGYEPREAEAIKEAGLELHQWMWTTNRGDQWIRDNHPEWYMVSRTGKSCYDEPPYVDYYRWVSPVIPGVRDYLADKVAEIAEREAVDGVHLDYVRYPDVILPRALWEQYGVDQTEEMAEYDFCYSEHTRQAFKDVYGRDPIDILDPAHDQEWLHFRYDSVTQLVERLKGVTKDYDKTITAAVFPTPRMARKICRQDWGSWNLDFFTPMIYHSFYNESVDWVGERVLEDVHATPSPIVAGLYMPAFGSAEEFGQCLDLCKRRGSSGVSLFGDVGDAYWDALGTHLSES